MFSHAHFCKLFLCYVGLDTPRELISIEVNYIAIKILSRSKTKCNLNGLLLHWQLSPGNKAHIVMYITYACHTKRDTMAQGRFSTLALIMSCNMAPLIGVFHFQ